jgi:hypothetical protein
MPISVPRVIVKFKPPADNGTLEAFCKRVAQVTGGTLVRPPGATGRAVFAVETSSNLEALIQEIESLPFVEYAEPDVVDRTSTRR